MFGCFFFCYGVVVRELGAERWWRCDVMRSMLMVYRDKENVKKHGKQKGGSWWWGGGDGTADEEDASPDLSSTEDAPAKKPEPAKSEQKTEAINPDDDVD
jgi:hypothetical protein